MQGLLIILFHWYKIQEQSIFSGTFSFVFNSKINSLSLTDQRTTFHNRHALNDTEFEQQYIDFAAGSLSKGPFLILHFMFLKIKHDHINSAFTLLKNLKTSHIKPLKCLWWTFHFFSDEVRLRSNYCYAPPLVLCGEFFESLSIAFFC